MKILLVTIIFTFINLFEGTVRMAEFKEILDAYPDSGNYHVNPKMFIFMKIRKPKTKKEKNKLDYNGKIIEIFIDNLGIRNEVLNLEDNHYCSIISASAVPNVDKDLILSTFNDIIEKINILSPDMFKKENEVDPNSYNTGQEF